MKRRKNFSKRRSAELKRSFAVNEMLSCENHYTQCISKVFKLTPASKPNKAETLYTVP